LGYSRNKATGITFNKISGKIRVLIVLIQPSDEDTPWEAGEAEGYFKSSKDFFEDPHQHSKVELELSVFGWVKSQKTKSELSTSADNRFLSSLVKSEAIALTDYSINYQEVDCLFIVVADNDWTWMGAWAPIGKPGYTTNDGYCQFSNVRIGSDFFSNDSQATSHEIGHAVFGQYHAAGMNTSRRENECGLDGEAEEYRGLDVMGYVYFFLSTLRQYLLGWLPEERVTILSHSGSVELCPREVENANEKQLVIVENDGEKYFTIELCEKKSETYNNNNFPTKIGYELLVNELGDVINNDGYGGYDSNVFLQKDNYYQSFINPGEEICGLGTKGNISIKYVSLTGEGEEVLAEVEVTIEGAEPTPTPTPTPTHTPTATPTPTPTPTPCEPEDIFVFPPSLTLKRNASGDITVKVTGEDGCAVAGETVTATINKAGKKRLSVSPTSAVTDENGRAIFTITAKKKVGKASITFRVRAEDIKDEVSVKVSNKVK